MSEIRAGTVLPAKFVRRVNPAALAPHTMTLPTHWEEP